MFFILSLNPSLPFTLTIKSIELKSTFTNQSYYGETIVEYFELTITFHPIEHHIHYIINWYLINFNSIPIQAHLLVSCVKFIKIFRFFLHSLVTFMKLKQFHPFLLYIIDIYDFQFILEILKFIVIYSVNVCY